MLETPYHRADASGEGRQGTGKGDRRRGVLGYPAGEGGEEAGFQGTRWVIMSRQLLMIIPTGPPLLLLSFPPFLLDSLSPTAFPTPPAPSFRLHLHGQRSG